MCNCLDLFSFSLDLDLKYLKNLRSTPFQMLRAERHDFKLLLLVNRNILKNPFIMILYLDKSCIQLEDRLDISCTLAIGNFWTKPTLGFFKPLFDIGPSYGKCKLFPYVHIDVFSIFSSIFVDLHKIREEMLDGNLFMFTLYHDVTPKIFIKNMPWYVLVISIYKNMLTM